jgi:hypothetical protein
MQKVVVTCSVAVLIVPFQNCSSGFKALQDSITSLSSAGAPVSSRTASPTPSPSPAPSGGSGGNCSASAVSATPYGSYIQPGASNGPALSVNAQQGRYPISRDIYGMNTYGGDQTLALELKAPVLRWGGDAASRYNWKVDSTNAGFDWFFIGGSGDTSPIANAQVASVIQNSHAAGGKALITIPMVGYLTSSSLVNPASNPQGLITDGILTGKTISGTVGYVNSTAQRTCSYPQSLYGNQQAYNPYVTVTVNGTPNVQCGNSLDPSGHQLPQLTEAQKLLNHIYTTPAWNQQWIQYLVSTFGHAGSGGVDIYQLDNEPSGWANTHRDVRPVRPTGDEITQISLLHAAVVKSTEPKALVLGPGDWGWPTYSPTGGYAQKYLAAMANYEKTNGVRLLDYFAEHFYPFAKNVANAVAGDAATQALRLETTRSLWDPTYVDPSWLNTILMAIPNFHSYVNSSYPGTKLAITEYNFGAVEDINGALAEADVLGIFAREKLDLATMWGPPTSAQPAAFSFRMYLNYDKQGSAFGETYVWSQSTNQSQLAIYSAQRACDQSLTLMAINKTGGDIVGPLSLTGFSPYTYAQVYNYNKADLTRIVRQPDMPVTTTGFTARYPANSLTLIVIPAQ